MNREGVLVSDSVASKGERQSFSDIRIGQRFASSGRTLTETDLAMFSMITGDRNAVHADEDYARSAHFKGRIFHGTFGISIVIAMTADLMQLEQPVVAALGLREWTFSAPLYVGDTVHADLEVVDKRETSGGKRGIISRRLRLIKHGEEVVQQGTADLMIDLQFTPRRAEGEG